MIRINKIFLQFSIKLLKKNEQLRFRIVIKNNARKTTKISQNKTFLSFKKINARYFTNRK